MAKYNVDAINGCMRKAQDYTSKYGGIADSFPQVCTSPTVYGKLSSSAGLATAVDALNSMLNEEFNAAENRLNGVAGALDAVVQSVSNTEHANTAALQTR